MNFSQPWPWPTAVPDTMYHPSSAHSVSSYFARPSKVVKSNSRNGSPRSIGRRKTTTSASVSTRTRSVVDSLRSQLRPPPPNDHGRSRPVSWHPNSLESLTVPSNLAREPPDLSAWTFTTAEVNGLITPVSYPAMNEPQIQELITPLDELTVPESGIQYGPRMYYDTTALSVPPIKGNPCVLSQAYASTLDPSWSWAYPSVPTQATTAPSSPDSLPERNIAFDTLSLNPSVSKSHHVTEELVGMGLYDSPADIQSTSLLFGCTSGMGRRGLKLEESFVPVESNHDDLDEDDDAPGEDDDADADTDADADAADESGVMGDVVDYNASIAHHLSVDLAPHADSLASRYLATLTQLNSAYYPAGQAAYGWI